MNSLGNVMSFSPEDLVDRSGFIPKNYHHLYPHAYDDLVFIIYQPVNYKYEGRRSSLVPLLQWFIFVFVASLILYALRLIVKRKPARATRVCKVGGETLNNYLDSFVDSLAVFLGSALRKFGNCRAERWFLISFSIFGLVFRIIYTDNLFAMFATPKQNRISSIEQLSNENCWVTLDISIDDDVYYRDKS